MRFVLWPFCLSYLLLSACGRLLPKQQAVITLGRSQFRESNDVLDPGARRAEGLLSALRQTCEKCGGRFDGSDCRCGPGPSGEVFSAAMGHCEASAEWRFNTACAALSGAAFSACLRQGLWVHGATRLVPLFSNESAPAVKAWVRGVAPSLWPRLPPTPSEGAGATIYVAISGPPRFFGDSLKLAYENQVFHPQSGSMVPPKGFVYLRAETLAELASTLGASPKHSPHLLAVPHEPLLADLARASNIAADSQQWLKARVIGATSLEDSCLTWCAIERQLLLPDESRFGFHAIGVDRYIRGIRQNREVRLLKGDEVLAKVVFDFSDRPSLVYRPKLSQAGDQLLVQVEVFDGSFQKLGESAFTLLDNAKSLRALYQNARGSLATGEQAILSFEGGYSLANPESYAWILRGPWASTDLIKGHSLLGWFQSSSDDALSYGLGLLPSYSGPPFTERSDGMHALAIERLLVGEGGRKTSGDLVPVRLIPLGSRIGDPATALAARLAQSIYGRRARVGSLSNKHELDSPSCTAKTRAVLDSGLILVAAAGNDSQRVSGTDLCPQNQLASANLVVVGAANGEAMETYSNFGGTSVDLAAPGEVMNDAGTSYAAPRVAYALAQLNAMIPEASNAQLRMALLLSATLPSRGPLPVRSGGMLSLAKARIALINLTKRFATETQLMRERVPFSVALGVAKAVAGKPVGADLGPEVCQRLRVLMQNEAVCLDQEATAQCPPQDQVCLNLAQQANTLPNCGF